MKKLLLLIFLAVSFSCSDDNENKQCDCDEVEYSDIISVDRVEHFSDPFPELSEFELEESSRDFYGVDCSEDNDTISARTFTSDVPQLIHYSYVVKKIECK